MKRLLLSILFFGAGLTSVNAQWQQLSQPTGGHILDVALHNGEVYISVANIIYKSTDNGMTWVNSRGDLPEFSDINSIGATPSALYAGANDSGTGDKFFVSTNGGSTWTETGGKGALNLAVDWENIGDTAFVATNFGAVHRTVDNGVTFEDMPSVGIGNTIDSWGDDLFYLGTGFVRISTDRGDSVSAPIGTSSDITFRFGTMRSALRIDTTVIVGAQGVFKLDADSVWQRASTGMPLSLGSPRPIITKLALLGDLLWAFSDVGIYVSADTAGIWSLLENSPSTGFVQRVKIDGNTIHMATQRGYFISDGATDTTVTFEQRINGLNHVNVTNLYAIDNEIFATALSQGIIKSSDDGATFDQFGGNLSSSTITSITKDSNRFYLSDGQGFYSSTDGTDWTALESGLIGNTIAAFNDTLFASSGSQIFKSGDSGASWRAVSPPFQVGAIAPTSYAFHDSVIFGGFNTVNVLGAIARSRDKGETWEITPGGGALTYSKKIIFVGDTAYAPVTTTFTGGGVYRSIDFGETWEKLSDQLDNEVGGAFDLAISGETLYTYTFSGIWKSTDGARNWEKISTDGLLSDFFFAGAPISINNGYLYYAPFNSGIFRFELDGSSTNSELPSEVVEDFRLDQNYPNPFNPSTNINFNLPESGLVTLKVYNLLGQEIAELVNGSMVSGSYSINFDASGLSSGVYIYRLQAGNQVQTKKMMLIK